MDNLTDDIINTLRPKAQALVDAVSLVEALKYHGGRLPVGEASKRLEANVERYSMATRFLVAAGIATSNLHTLFLTKKGLELNG